MKKRIGLIVAMILVLCATGCKFKGEKAPAEPPSASPEAPAYVTAFGTVRCEASFVLALPVEICLSDVYVQEGQSITEGTPVFAIDMERLQNSRALLDQQLACAKAGQNNLSAQLEQAREDLASAQAAEDNFSTENLLSILKRLANAGSGSDRDSHEAELLAFLVEIDRVSQYQTFFSLTTDRRNVVDQARPAALQLKENLTQNRKMLESSRASLQIRLQQAQVDALSLKQKADIMKDICCGHNLCGIGCFRENGDFVITDRPMLITATPSFSNQAFAAGEVIAAFEAPDARVIRANIEEQLITGVSVGAKVQISPLYDKGVVWMGKVDSIADRAIVVNGETVVPVTITAEKLDLDPGYNVTVRIYPSSGAQNGG